MLTRLFFFLAAPLPISPNISRNLVTFSQLSIHPVTLHSCGSPLATALDYEWIETSIGERIEKCWMLVSVEVTLHSCFSPFETALNCLNLINSQDILVWHQLTISCLTRQCKYIMLLGTDINQMILKNAHTHTWGWFVCPFYEENSFARLHTLSLVCVTPV